MFDHFMFLPEGDCYEPDGYSKALSAAVVTTVVGKSLEYQARTISVVSRFLNRACDSGANPRAAIEATYDEGVDRIIGLLGDLGYPTVPCRKANRAEEFEVMVPEGKSTVHVQQIIGMLRQFLQQCGSFKVGTLTRANPVELPGWEKLEEEQRRASWKDRFPKRPYGWLNAGLRFRPSQRKAYLPLIEDPTGCAQAMTRAVVKYGCPANVIAICIVMEENGCRWREAAWANAYGWSIKGFGPTAYTTNKHEPGPTAKKIALRPDVHSGVVRDFESRPHPTIPGRSMMDHLRELAAAGDRKALLAIPLFPNSRGRRYGHSTFNGHWFRPAMEAWENEDGTTGLLIFSDIGSRRPTPHWYRHAEITRRLEIEVVGCKSDAEILEKSKVVCRRFKLKVEQAKRYAASLMIRLAEESHLRDIVDRRAEIAAERAGVDITPALSRHTLSESEIRLRALPARRAVAA